MFCPWFRWPQPSVAFVGVPLLPAGLPVSPAVSRASGSSAALAASMVPAERNGSTRSVRVAARDWTPPVFTVIGMGGALISPRAACLASPSEAPTGSAPVVAESAPTASDRTPRNVTVLRARNLSLPNRNWFVPLERGAMDVETRRQRGPPCQGAGRFPSQGKLKNG